MVPHGKFHPPSRNPPIFKPPGLGLSECSPGGEHNRQQWLAEWKWKEFPASAIQQIGKIVGDYVVINNLSLCRWLMISLWFHEVYTFDKAKLPIWYARNASSGFPQLELVADWQDGQQKKVEGYNIARCIMCITYIQKARQTWNIFLRFIQVIVQWVGPSAPFIFQGPPPNPPTFQPEFRRPEGEKVHWPRARKRWDVSGKNSGAHFGKRPPWAGSEIWKKKNICRESDVDNSFLLAFMAATKADLDCWLHDEKCFWKCCSLTCQICQLLKEGATYPAPKPRAQPHH